MTCDKITYDTYQLAVSAAHGVSRDGKSTMKAYRCHDCGKYHLATQGKKKWIRDIRPVNWGAIKIKNKNPRSLPKAPPKEVPLSTYKMLSKEQAANLKRLIEGNNHVEKQKAL